MFTIETDLVNSVIIIISIELSKDVSAHLAEATIVSNFVLSDNLLNFIINRNIGIGQGLLKFML